MSTAPFLDHTGKRAFELFGDRKEPTTTREKLLEVAIDRFYVQGFHAVGLDQILNEVGVTKTTFYNHFESKDELIIEALARREQWETNAFMQRATEIAGDDPKALLVAFFDVLDEWFKHPDYYGCLFMNVCVEFPSPNDPIHQAGCEHYTKSKARFSELAQAAGAADPERLAEQLLILIQGTLTHRQVTGDNDAAAKARGVAAALIEQAVA
jgi:AcrR family transcriptional regulator